MANAATLIKDPYTKTVFKTQQELDDFITCCDPVTGYLYFMDNFFYIQHPTKGSMLYHPYKYQERLIETYHKYRYSIALMPRQSGKCFGINTIVTVRNIKTNKIEDITIGEFYDRFSKVPNLRDNIERTAFAPVQETQNDGYSIQDTLSKRTDTLSEFVRNKFEKFFWKSKSWLPTQRYFISFFQKIHSRGHFSSNKCESRTHQKTEQLSFYKNRLLVERNKRKFRSGSAFTFRTTDYLFFKEMYKEIWNRRWDDTLAKTATNMVKKFQKTKLFCRIAKIVQSNNGIIPFRTRLLCYPTAGGYERLFEQRVSFNIDFGENYFTGFYRLRKEKNNRIRWNILARTTEVKCEERNRKGTEHHSKWISDSKSERRRLQESSTESFIRMSDLSASIERKFIESYIVENYEILTDTGFEQITDLHLTVPYDVYKLETESGLVLECADTHILFDQHLHQVFAKNLTPNSLIQTNNGVEKIKYVNKTNRKENMFDVTVDHHNHRFYTNGILSHNTTSAAGYLLWYAMFVPDSTILIAAHKYAGAQEIMQRIRYAYENCPMYIKAGVATYNKGSLFFDNGSRIVSATTTENTGRGMSISLLYLDEFAFVRPTIAEQFWTSITPTLATGGKAMITSTPNSDEDQFALIWKLANKTEDEYGNKTDTGINGFKAFSSHWSEQPGRDEKWAKQMRSQLGDDRFEREINCQFIIADETLINPNTLIQLESIEPIDRMGQVRWYKKPTKGNIYVVGLDPSLGTGSDPSAIQIFEANTTEQVGEWKHNKTEIPQQIKLLADINKYIVECTGEPNNLYYSLENNSIGEAALISLAEFGESNIPGIFFSETGKKRKGFNTTHKVKLTACAKFKTLLESKKMKLHSRSLISELKTFVALGGSYSAKIGETDDLVMATLLVVRMLQQLTDFHYDLENQMRDHEEIIQPLPFFAVLS